MVEIIWRFRPRRLDDESDMTPILEAVAQTPGFEPVQYDLNQMEQWREFDLEHAVVDALTQRTQLVRVQGAEAGALAMIALGKRDEQPTAIVRLPDAADNTAHVSRLAEVFEALPIESAVISSGRWRRALQEAGLSPEAMGGLLGMVTAWRRGAIPAAVEDLDQEMLADTPVRLHREANHVQLHLADGAQVDDEAHQRALEFVSRRLLKRG